jgi:hypothetical protein
MYRKWRIAAKQANNSLSKVDYLVWAGSSFLEKNLMAASRPLSLLQNSSHMYI